MFLQQHSLNCVSPFKLQQFANKYKFWFMNGWRIILFRPIIVTFNVMDHPWVKNLSLSHYWETVERELICPEDLLLQSMDTEVSVHKRYISLC